MKKILFSALLLACGMAWAQPLPPATTPFTRTFLRAADTNAAYVALSMWPSNALWASGMVTNTDSRDLTFSQVTASFTGNGAGVTNLGNGVTLTNLPVNSSWSASRMPIPHRAWAPWFNWTTLADTTNNVNADLFAFVAEWVVTNVPAVARQDYCLLMDDGWEAPTLAADGSLQWNTTMFPNGIAEIVTNAHARGLKAGIYTSWGGNTCYGLPGTHPTNVFRHVKQFIDWGFDFIKVDACSGWEADPVADFNKRVRLLNAAIQAAKGHASLSVAEPEGFARSPEVNNVNITCMLALNGGWDYANTALGNARVIDYFYTNMLRNAKYHMPGAFQFYCATRPSGGPTSTYKTLISLAGLSGQPMHNAIFNANKFGTNMSNWDYQSLNLYYHNEEFAAIHQDSACVPASVVSSNTYLWTWVRPMGGRLGDPNVRNWAVGFFNAATNGAQAMSIPFSSLMTPTNDVEFNVRSVWGKTNVGGYYSSFSASIAEDNSEMFLITALPKPSYNNWRTNYIPADTCPANIATGLARLSGSSQSPKGFINGFIQYGTASTLAIYVPVPNNATNVMIEGLNDISFGMLWTNRVYWGWMTSTGVRELYGGATCEFEMGGANAGVYSWALTNRIPFATNAFCKFLSFNSTLCTNTTTNRYVLGPFKMTYQVLDP